MKLKFKHIENIKLFFIIIFSIFFIITTIIIFWKSDDGVVRYESALKQNVLNMDKLMLTYVIDNNSYFTLKSDTGSATISDYFVNLNDLNIYYSGSNFKVNASADNGKYELQRKITAYGNINGMMDNMSFQAGKDGVIIYDYKDGVGTIDNGITVKQGNNNIKSKMAEFNVFESFVLFKDNVSVEYSSKGEN